MRRQQIKEIAHREFRTRARSRGYRGITAIMLLLAIAAPIVMSVLPNSDDDLREVRIGIATTAPDGIGSMIESLAEGALDVTIVEIENSSDEDLEEQLRDGSLDVLLRAPATLVWDEASDSTITSLITAALQQQKALTRVDQLGIDASDLATAFEPIEIEAEFFNGSSNTEDVRRGVAFFGLFLAFLLPQVFGQFTMMSVVEEKATRVVEVLLSQIRPGTLLAGKIIGLCALATVQLLIIVAGLVVSLLVTDLFDVPASVWQFVPMMLVSVLGGLIMYTTLFALLGSLISRQEDQAQVLFPVFAPLMVGYFIGQTAAFGNSETVLIKVLTLFPLTSPMLLPVRVARGTIGPIETVISLGLLTAASYGLFRLAGRIYEFTLLRTGSRVGWREVIRLSRGAVTD